MIPGIPGGTQLACGESCGGLAWNSLSMAWYFGVSESCCAAPSPPPRPPNVISQTPFRSGSCAIDAHVPPGNLLASAAMDGEAAKAHSPRPNIGRTSLRMDVFSFKRLLYNINWRLLRGPPGVKMVLDIHFEIK